MKPEREPYIQIIVGILAVAAIPPLGVILFDGSESLTILERWQSGVGAFLGAFFGLGAILIGALFNADLNRKRDERLRDEEARALAASLTGEIEIIAESVGILAQQANLIYDGEYLRPEDIWSPRVIIFEANADRIGLLGIDTAGDISHVIGVTYTLADGVRGRLRGFVSDYDMVAETADQTTAIEKSARQLAENLRQKALPPNTPPAPPAEDQPDHSPPPA